MGHASIGRSLTADTDVVADAYFKHASLVILLVAGMSCSIRVCTLWQTCVPYARL
jgi:hypothetical protein